MIRTYLFFRRIYPGAAEAYEGFMVMAQATFDGKCDGRTNL